MMEFEHIPVLFNETIDALNIKEDGVYVDGTAGGAGHSTAIAKKIKTGILMSIDQDPDAIKVCTERLSQFEHAKVVRGNFSDIENLVKENLNVGVDGILLDIGVSSHQLDTADRGFSFHQDAELDMRMSQSGISAKDIVANSDVQELINLIRKYGEDKNAVRIARAIVEYRQTQQIVSTMQLADIIRNAVPAAVRRKDGHPARKTFQALRIAVNGELDRLKDGLTGGFNVLNKGGRFCVITFHSLEDRIVKEQMRDWCTGCTCPKDFPICVCGNKPKAKLVFRKSVAPSKEELEQNPRARSSRLRVIEKV